MQDTCNDMQDCGHFSCNMQDNCFDVQDNSFKFKKFVQNHARKGCKYACKTCKTFLYGWLRAYAQSTWLTYAQSSRFHLFRNSCVSFIRVLCLSRVTLKSWEEPQDKASWIPPFDGLYMSDSFVPGGSSQPFNVPQETRGVWEMMLHTDAPAHTFKRHKRIFNHLLEYNNSHSLKTSDSTLYLPLTTATTQTDGSQRAGDSALQNSPPATTPACGVQCLWEHW